MNESIGALIVDLQGLTLTKEEAELLNHPLVGGVIFFTKNYESRAQLEQLCKDVRKSRKKPLLIMADQEGGRVQRFRDEFFPLPSLAHFGEWYDKDPKIALQLTKTCGWLMANEILAMGIDLSLAPVLDINKGLNTVIGTRAFHVNPDVVFKLAVSYAQGMKQAGMATTGKHFPGHGSVEADSHLSVPVDKREFDQVMAEDLQPFKRMITEGIDAIMAAHILFPKIDRVQAGFSQYWLKDILRKRLGFKGVTLTDDLNMQGANISANYADRVAKAREAGCDFALLCNNREGVIQTLDHLNYQDHQVDQSKWHTLQAKTAAKQCDDNIQEIKAAKEYLQEHAEL